MKRRIALVIFLVLVAAAIVWKVSQPKPLEGAASSLEPFLGPGEVLTYRLSISSNQAGTATLTLSPDELIDGRHVRKAVALTRSNNAMALIYAVNDTMESCIDPSIDAPCKFTKEIREGDKHRIDWIEIDQQQHRAAHKRTKIKAGAEPFTYTRAEIDVPDRVQDPLSAYYRLRNLKLPVGGTVEIPVTADRKAGTLTVNVVGHERLHLETIGEVDALRVAPRTETAGLFGTSGGANVHMWLDAQTHALLKVEAPTRLGGTLTAELIAVENTERPGLGTMGKK